LQIGEPKERGGRESAHLLANEVDVDLDMLGATVVDRINSHVDGTNVVGGDLVHTADAQVEASGERALHIA